MARRKIILVLLLGLIGFAGHSQMRPNLYGGIDYFRNKTFAQNSYLNFSVGSQLFRWKFLAPEVGYEYHFGRVRERNERISEHPGSEYPSQLRTRFSSHTFSFAPKIMIGNDEAALVLIPQYNTGRITAMGRLMEFSGRRYKLAEQQKISNSIDFWSFAAGVEGDFFNSDLVHFSLLVKYHFLNSEETLQQLDLENTELKSIGGSADGIGLSMRVYIDLLQLL